MLGKVLSVDSKNNYRSNAERVRVDYYKTQSHTSVYKQSDSSDFSRESVYISTLPWKLNNYKYNKKESVKIDFELGGYNFRSIIDISKSNFPTRYELYIDNNNGDSDNFTVALDAVLMSFTSGKSSFKYISTLFQRIKSLKIYADYKIFEDSILHSIWEDISDEVTSEIGYVTNMIYTFFCKLIGEENSTAKKEDFYCTLHYLQFKEKH